MSLVVKEFFRTTAGKTFGDDSLGISGPRHEDGVTVEMRSFHTCHPVFMTGSTYASKIIAFSKFRFEADEKFISAIEQSKKIKKLKNSEKN